MQSDQFPPPVFVLAAPGMPGQTLAAALGRNPAAYDLPELNLELMETVDSLQRELSWIRGAQIQGLLRALAQVLAGEQTGPAIEMARRWLTRRGYLSTGAVAAELAARIAPWRIVAPVTAAIFDRISLRRLRQSFPGAVYIHLHLHPHVYGRLITGQLAGEIALQLVGAVDESATPPIPDPQDLWLTAETAIADFLADLPEEQVIAQPLAPLARDPGPCLEALATRLGLPADAAACARMLAPELSDFAGPGPMGAPLPGNIESLADLAETLPDTDGASLQVPLPWRPDNAAFRDAVRDRAGALGYR